MNIITSRQKIQAADSNVPIILVVEDDMDNLLYLSHTLILLKYNFVTATTGQDALDLANKYEIDLILMDLILPDIDGIEIIDRLKRSQHTKNVPIIAITAIVKQKGQNRAQSVGCDDYLEKPYLIEDLKDKIRTYLPQSCSQPKSFIRQTLTTILSRLVFLSLIPLGI